MGFLLSSPTAQQGLAALPGWGHGSAGLEWVRASGLKGRGPHHVLPESWERGLTHCAVGSQLPSCLLQVRDGSKRPRARGHGSQTARPGARLTESSSWASYTRTSLCTVTASLPAEGATSQGEAAVKGAQCALHSWEAQ